VHTAIPPNSAITIPPSTMCPSTTARALQPRALQPQHFNHGNGESSQW
jgi:hypothetical protein